MKSSIVVLSVFILAFSLAQEGGEPTPVGDGFSYEYRKFDNAIRNFQRPPTNVHIQNLKNAIPLRLIIDIVELKERGINQMPKDCTDDNNNPTYCQYNQIGENVDSSYVDAVVILPWQQYPQYAENLQEDPNFPDIDRRQEALDNYLRQVNSSINVAVNQASCEIISNSHYSVGYTTKYGYTVGIICPDDKTYRNRLATNPNFYNNVMKASLGRTLNLKANIGEKFNFDPIRGYSEPIPEGVQQSNGGSSGSSGSSGAATPVATVPTPVGTVPPPVVTVTPPAGNNGPVGVVGVGRSESEVDSDVDKRQLTISPVTGYDYSHAECGGVWYKDYLADGQVDGTCVGQRCEYIKLGGQNAQFYLLDSGVDWTHPEFNSAVSQGRLKNVVVLNRTELRRWQWYAVSTRYLGVLPKPAPLPVVVNYIPYSVSPWATVTKLPISPTKGIPLNSIRTETLTGVTAATAASIGPFLTVGSSLWTGPMDASTMHYWDYIEDPIVDKISHGTSMAAIILGDKLGIAKRTKLTSYKVMTHKGMIEYAIKTAINQIVLQQKINAVLGRSQPTVLVTGINFAYDYYDCVTPTSNCALDTISGLQLLIRWGVAVITPAMNGYINVREFYFPPPGMTVPFPFIAGFDSCHWANYVQGVQAWADASYDGRPAYFPQFLINGNEVPGYNHIRPMRTTGFNHDVQMVPWLYKQTDSLGYSVLETLGFNFGDCIDFAVPGSEFESLAVLNQTTYGNQDINNTGIKGFTVTDNNYPFAPTNWFESLLPTSWKATGKSFKTGYKNAPYLSGGTSYSTPIAAAVVASSLLDKWGVGYAPSFPNTGNLKPTYSNIGRFMEKAFFKVNALNRMPGTYTQPHTSNDVSYSGLENLNGLWGVTDPDQSTYPQKKNPAFRPIKMFKTVPSCV